MPPEYLFAAATNEGSKGVELKDVAELQVVVEGVPLPSERAELVGYAGTQGATPTQLRLLACLPDREFDTIDEIAECLISVQPVYANEVPHRPHEESGAPPGGDAYANPSPVSGFVRDRGHG
jgi:hypothetical protein